MQKKVSVTGAGHLRECKNTDFVWELRKMGFCEGGRKESCPLMRASVRRASSVQVTMKGKTDTNKEPFEREKCTDNG